MSNSEESSRLAHYQAIGDLALRRHAACRTQHPRRGAASLLRVVIAAALHMAAHADLFAAALALLDRVILVAQTEECALAQAGNSAAYLNVWLAAEAARDRIMSSHEEQQLATTQEVTSAEAVAPTSAGMQTVASAILARAARRLVKDEPSAHYAPPTKPDKRHQRPTGKWR